jgi:hypothetical protein
MRFGLRAWRKTPGFTAAAILTLALGIGATTAVFSVVDAWLLRPLPFKEPERLRGGRRRSIQQSLCGVVTDPGFDREAAQT